MLAAANLPAGFTRSELATAAGRSRPTVTRYWNEVQALLSERDLLRL